MPEGPAIAGRSVLKSCSHLVDGARMCLRRNRAISPHRRHPATLVISKNAARRDEATLNENSEGDPRLSPLVGHRLHGALVERQRRVYSVACYTYVGWFTLDPDPAA